MEWMNRGQGQGQPAGPAANHTAAPASVPGTKKQRGGFSNSKLMRFAQIALLFSVTVLLVAVVWFVALGGNTKPESSYVDKNKVQAVFLNGGQVYFGNITELNNEYLSMANIYYLRVNQQVQPNQTESANSNDVSLVKLGCELHGPEDRMVINHEQVIFWENLKSDGQVTKAIAEYVKQNPNGQNCEASSNNSGSNTGNTTNTNQDTGNTNTGTNNGQ